ncbi:MAG: phosphoribosylaminoimidazolesuccinocarboxamide synthase [Deltaproteobacteria bacterium]|jgi:phosphoribosylaminoimidazole-succinocarboxamide synthase|nr:phosphoribosylaminoimidazolesuccinocarboxamide synthase [Deltaproteobacteria bacterium]
MQEIKQLIEKYRNKTFPRLNTDKLVLFHQGKVRDIYKLEEDKLLFFISDRVSVFDKVVGEVPFKGQILNSISNWWFEQVKQIIPVHLLEVPHPSMSIVKKLETLKVEIIVRGYLAGNSSTSIWTAYKNGNRTYCGHKLPEGLVKYQVLPRPLVTPTTKGDVGEHDELISKDEIIKTGLVGKDLYETLEKKALALFELGSNQAKKRGLILADTKYEFGLDKTGELYLIDEVHTPDSSRYWYQEDYKKRFAMGKAPRGLDKDYVRNYMKEQGYNGEGKIPPLPDEVKLEAATRYAYLYQKLTGKDFRPQIVSPLEVVENQL